MRLLLIAFALSVVAGCVQRAGRASLAARIDDDDRAARDRGRHERLPPVDVPPWKLWRFAGTRGGEHVVVHVTADGERHRYALPEREFVMPADLAYTDDDARWIPLNLERRVQADGSDRLDFTRMSSNQIDALHSLGR